VHREIVLYFFCRKNGLTEIIFLCGITKFFKNMPFQKLIGIELGAEWSKEKDVSLKAWSNKFLFAPHL
jgi:hypothetical protein